MQSNLKFLIFTLAACLLFSGNAFAVGMMVYGADARSSALGGAMAGWATDATAAYYNPAGLAFAETNTFKLGYKHTWDYLDLKNRGYNPYMAQAAEYYGQRNKSMMREGGTISEPAAYDFGFSFKVWRIGFGFDSYTPQHTLLDEKFRLFQQPYLLDFDNTTEHAVPLAGLGIKVLDNLSVGVGSALTLDVVGKLPVRIPLKFNPLNDPDKTNLIEGEAVLDQKILAAFTLSAGMMWQPIEPLKIGFVWRSEERRVGKECRSRWSPYH